MPQIRYKKTGCRSARTVSCYSKGVTGHRELGYSKGYLRPVKNADFYSRHGRGNLDRSCPDPAYILLDLVNCSSETRIRRG
jgi:hypothetical protein